MSIKIWDRTQTTFFGQVQVLAGGSTTLALSQGGRFEASALYGQWRELMEITPDFHFVEIEGPNGEQVLRGVWLTRDDNPLVPGQMTAGGADLLDELRLLCLPQDYSFTNHSVLAAMGSVLSYQDDWTLGNTTLADEVAVTANLGGSTLLQALADLCELSGNFFRWDGWTRTLDVFADGFTEIQAYLVSCAPGEDMPPGAARVESLNVETDCGEVLRGVIPLGGNYQDSNDQEQELTCSGQETLPAGYSFQNVAGQLAIVNNAVTHGLVKAQPFDAVQALSNTSISTSGKVETSGAGWIESEAVRRPSDGFWNEGVVTVAETDYTVTGHSGDRISAPFGTLAVGTPFSLRKDFEYDGQAVEEARQALATAATRLLARHAAASIGVSVLVRDLDVNTRLAPGDRVRLECIGQAQVKEPWGEEIATYQWNGFRGELIVTEVVAQFAEGEMRWQLALTDSLRRLASVSGLAEMRQYAPRSRPTRGRGRGVAYTLTVTAADPVCAAGDHQKTLTFPTAYAAVPEVLEAVALHEDYSVESTVVTRNDVTVCVSCSGVFDQVTVLVRLREP